jgi:hypothetical protein
MVCITGVQLEAGTTASDFEFLPVDVNLQRCQRYCYRTNGIATDINCLVQLGFFGTIKSRCYDFIFQMRTTPTLQKEFSMLFRRQ